MVSQKINKTKKRSRGPRRMITTDGNREAVSRYAGDAYSLATRTWNGLNELRKLVNIEKKYFDVLVVNTPTINGAVSALSQMAQGVTENTRIGNSIKVHRLLFRASIQINPTVTTFSWVRILLVRDNEGQGANPSGGQILETVGVAGAPLSHRNFDNSKRFNIIYDNFVTLTPLTGGSSTQQVDLVLDLEKHVSYRDATAAATGNAEGATFCVTYTNEPTNTPNVDLCSRIEYTDD